VSDKELSGRELDAAVAERVMGYRNHNPELINLTPTHMAWHTAISPTTGNREIVPCYSSSIEAAMQVEDRIAELGLQNDYVAHIWSVVGATRNGVNFWTADNFKAFWLCIHATAEQRCRAALAAIESKE
jgi:hypothetical protein